MRLLARVEDFVQLGRLFLTTIKFWSEDGLIRVNERVQIRKPDGQVKYTFVAAIEHM